MKKSHRLLLSVLVLGVTGYFYWKFAVPAHRVDIRSELVMMGDLDGDSRWASGDRAILQNFMDDPSVLADETAWRLDLNRNGLIDKEDVDILEALIDSGGDPYRAEEQHRFGAAMFPRPRELYRYVSNTEYRIRPLWALPYSRAKGSILEWLFNKHARVAVTFYKEKLDAAIYAEAVRFDRAWRKREPDLLPVERDYADRKLVRLKELSGTGQRHELLLGLIELVEDAETLTTRDASAFALKFLTLRDHVRGLLRSQLFREFEEGERPWQDVLRELSAHIKADIGQAYNLEALEPPRNYSSLENYLQRSEWQYYKSTARDADFRMLIQYAQHDPRYLAAASRTNQRHRDPDVANHNLPMVLLFREALRIEGGDKKRAVGLLDESIRIPYAWIRSIPRNRLPDSLALENFLLPGNKEDGADKSRHWNVFGGLCLYKTPEEALELALRRELQDLRNEHCTVDAMREFLRDMIANLNGMYHVMVLDPKQGQGEVDKR